jgi:hypothetical protein
MDTNPGGYIVKTPGICGGKPRILDEHVPRAIADGLRRRGIDASTTVEAGLRSAMNEAHLAYARTQGRVMVTCDRLGRLHAASVCALHYSLQDVAR